MLFAAAPAPAVDAAAALSLQSFPRAPPSPSLEELSLSLGLSYDAVASIYSQGAQLAAAGPHARARREAGPIAEKFAEAIGVGGDGAMPPTSTSSSSSSFAALEALSSAARVPAALLLRRVLESAPFGVPRTAVTDFMRCPRAAVAARATGGGATSAATAAPPPPLLAAAADAAAAASALDPLYSPRGDALRHVAGAEAEALLCARLRSAGGGGLEEEDGNGNKNDDGGGDENENGGGGSGCSSSSGRGVPFWTEGALRAGGFALTPDVRLATPVALPCGHVVHWIDSKATFGTVRMHEHYLEEQYARYVNRYGGGLVIYWSGFDERLLSSSSSSSSSSSTAAAAASAAAAGSTSSSGPSSFSRSPPPSWRAGVAVAATLPSALRGALRTLPRLALPPRAAPAPAALLAE